MPPNQIRHPELHKAHQAPPPLPHAAIIYQHALGKKSCCEATSGRRAWRSVAGGRMRKDGAWRHPGGATSCRTPQSCHTEPQRQRPPSKKLQQAVNIHKNKYCKRQSSRTPHTHPYFSSENPDPSRFSEAEPLDTACQQHGSVHLVQINPPCREISK